MGFDLRRLTCDQSFPPPQVIVTNQVGEFRIGGLAPGSYSMEVRRRGFRLLRSSAFRLEAGTELKLRGSLEIGRIRETINVIGN